MFSILFRSFWYDRWINLAVMAGVLCTAAVLTGALLVGDSMRGSLRSLTIDRLGKIDTILFASQFIEFSEKQEASTPKSGGVILLPAAVEFDGKISGVQLLGIGTKCIANQALADKIGIQETETLSLRLMSPQSIPPESALGRKDQLIRTRIPIDEIIPNQELGRFSLKMDQQAEPLLLVPLDWLQNRLDVGKKVNAVFFYTDSPQNVSTPEQRKDFEQSFKPRLEDLGITTEESFGSNVYLKSQRMLFNDEQAEIIQRALGGGETADDRRQTATEGGVREREKTFTKGLLYLATSIRSVQNDRETPYSTIYAVESEKFDLSDDEIALNQWTADDLGVELGSEIELTWFDPDDVSISHSKTFTLSTVLPMEGLGADPLVVPNVEGFTDEAAIADWDPPFPFDAKKIRQKDEDYWDRYKAAPKAFLSLSAGQELFASRFGKVTTFTVKGTETLNTDAVENSLLQQLPAEKFGINFVPVKEQGLAASSGTTPFSILFLSFSFFIIASALMLVMMLFRLSIEMKTKRIGIQLAVGWSKRSIAKTLLAEGFLISLFGSFFGAILGIGYAALMVYGLTTWWVDAVTVPFLTLHINPVSLIVGFISSIVLAMLTILGSLRGITKVPIRSLLFGVVQKERIGSRHSPIASLLDFAYSNAERKRIQSMLCVGLIGSTAFLILSISAFRLESSSHLEGAGGFFSIAETMFPVYADPSLPEGREKLSIQPSDEEFLRSVLSSDDICSFRIKAGDNASCLNLYRTDTPRILGIPKKLRNDQHRFGSSNIWHSIEQPITIDPDGIRRVPVILDANTAQYSLHLYGGVGSVYEYNDGANGILRCEVVGLLHNSILQGDILMSEENLLTSFPYVGGYQFFLFGKENVDDRTLSILYDMLGDYGFQCEPTADRLRKLFAIQNTYLSTFQSLGGIGLLLGVLGLAVIQCRNVLERRKELALLQTFGFTKFQTILVLLYESLMLLCLGLILAFLASVIVLITLCYYHQVSVVSFTYQLLILAGSLLLVAAGSNIAAALSILKIPVARELAEER